MPLCWDQTNFVIGSFGKSWLWYLNVNNNVIDTDKWGLKVYRDSNGQNVHKIRAKYKKYPVFAQKQKKYYHSVLLIVGMYTVKTSSI